MRKLLVLIFLCFVLPTSLMAAQKLSVDGLVFNSLPSLNSRTNIGYLYYPVLVNNISHKERKITLSLEASYSSELGSVSRTFIIGPLETRIEAIYFPVIEISSRGIRVEVDGVEVRDVLKPNVSVYKNYYGRDQALVDARISRSEFDGVFAGVSGGSSRRSHGDVEMNQFEGSNSQFATNWLAYSQFNFLLFYADSFAEMNAEARRAIFSYLRAGGSMMILGDFSPPEDFAPANFAAPKGVVDFRSYASGFGRLFVAPQDALSTVATSSGNPFPSLITDPLTSVVNSSGGLFEFDENQLDNVSVQWLMILIYAFAFIIGPVNVYVLHKIGRKIWVFWTVPAASVICCLMIFGYYLLFESSIVLVKKRAVTLLDENKNLGITLGSLGVFSSSTNTEGLKFSSDTEVMVLGDRRSRRFERGQTILLNDGQHFRDGWIRPKIPRYFHLRRVHTCRERLTIENTGSGCEVLNGLGADIIDLSIMMDDAHIWEARNVPAGARTRLQKTARIRKSSLSPTSMSQFFASEWYKRYANLKSAPHQYLKPGMYIAHLKKAPFIEKLDFDDSENDEDSFVVGIMARGTGK
jgi:hypothetical protein